MTSELTGPDGMEVEIVARAPAGAPADFRERLALHLKTTDAARLQAAESDFRGVWESEDQYIAEQVAELQPVLPHAGLAARASPALDDEGPDQQHEEQGQRQPQQTKGDQRVEVAHAPVLAQPRPLGHRRRPRRGDTPLGRRARNRAP